MNYQLQNCNFNYNNDNNDNDFIITPKKMHKQKTLPYNFDFAFLCYCPLPEIFREYEIKNNSNPDTANTRYFVHLHPIHVIYCEYNSRKFIVLSEVYMGIGTTFLEELYFYGIKKVVGLGYVGSMSYKIGTNVFAEKSLIENGTTPHYLDLNLDLDLNSKLEYVYGSKNICTDLDIKNVTVWTTNGFYRETKNEVMNAITKGCDVVNMDTSHFYACGNKLEMNVTYYATVSDMVIGENEIWKNDFDNILGDTNNKDMENILIKNQRELIKYLIIKNTSV